MAAITASERYALTYQNHPRKAAAALRRAREQAQWARQDGDLLAAQEFEEIGDALEAVLGGRRRCRACGRALQNPVSVAAGIGPECAGRE